MNKPHKSRNSEPNKQSPRNILEIFSCSWALENFSHSRGLRTDISQKTVVGCPWGKLIWFLVQHNLTSSDFLGWKKRLIHEEANIFIILLSWSSLKREHVLFSMIEGKLPRHMTWSALAFRGLPRCKNLWTFSLFRIFCFSTFYWLTSLLPLNYVTCEFNRFLHRGWADFRLRKSKSNLFNCRQ